MTGLTARSVADLAGTGDSIKTKADADPAINADAVHVRARYYLAASSRASSRTGPAFNLCRAHVGDNRSVRPCACFLLAPERGT